MWVGMVGLAHHMVAADSSMTHAYALHLLERFTEHSVDVKEQLKTYRSKTEEGKTHATARQTLCRCVIRLP